jgi:anti-sigma regulatory factor (Ser/Thr protein kinase)
MSFFKLLKMLLSKETRETAGEILKLIKRSPEWKKDLVIAEGKFSSSNKEQVQVLISHAVRLLAGKKWDDEEIQRGRFVSLELLRNAFEHGLKQEPKGEIQVKIEVSSNFYRIDIIDPGHGFDLSAELQCQGAKDRYSNKCRALGFIYRMVTDLSQNISGHRHTISAVLQKGYNPCEVEKIDNITIFEFRGETQPSGYFWAEIVREIEELTPDHKVILDFTKVDDISTRALSEILRLLTQYKWIEYGQMTREPKPMEFLAMVRENDKEKVVACGVENINYVLRDFLKTRFKCFPDKKQALKYFEVG